MSETQGSAVWLNNKYWHSLQNKTPNKLNFITPGPVDGVFLHYYLWTLTTWVNWIRYWIFHIFCQFPAASAHPKKTLDDRKLVTIRRALLSVRLMFCRLKKSIALLSTFITVWHVFQWWHAVRDLCYNAVQYDKIYCKSWLHKIKSYRISSVSERCSCLPKM